MSRTTEVNDLNEMDALPEEGIKEEHNDEHIVKSHQGNTNSSTANTANIANTANTSNGIKDKDKQASNKNLKEREKQRPDGNRVEKQDNPIKNKGRVDSSQTVNPKQNFNLPKNKLQQQHNKQNVANDSSADESKN